MRELIITAAFASVMAFGFSYTLTNSLTDMTKRDCYHGVEKACLELKKNGGQP